MMASRKSSHKMKSAITDERKKKLLRVHRRSLDQREMRQEQINKRRQIEDMSPVVESQEASKNPSKAGTPVIQTAAVSRHEMLKKWKEERELKRKLEAMEKGRSKPGFRVKHIEYHEADLYNKMKMATETAQGSGQASKQTAVVKPAPPRPKASKSSKEAVVPAAAKPATAKTNVKPTTRATSTTNAAGKRTAGATTRPEKKPAVPPATRTTRNRGTAATKTTSPVAPKKAKPSPAKRTAKPNFMAPTAASQTRAIAGSKKEAAPPAATTHKRRGGPPPRAAAVKDTGKVSTRRGGAGSPTQPSFAPSDFVFEAPSTVQSFVFKPLSPASSAGFLFPQGSANSTTMVAFTEKVGRTSTPKGDRLPPSSSEEDTSDETHNQAVITDHSDRSSARRSRSMARRSRTMPADGSPILESKTAANKTPVTVVGESGIEVDAGTDTASEKTATQESSADTATSAEEGEAVPTEPKSSPVKSRKGRKSRQSVSGKQKAEEPEPETENAGETEQPVVEGNEESAPSQPRKGKRKSKRVSIQAEVAADPEDAPAAKQRRKSRKSTTSSKLEVVSELDNVPEPAPPQPAVSEEMAEEQKTPRKSSRRSTAAKSQDLVLEADTEEKTDQPEQKKTASRRSRRSNLPDAGDSVVSKPAEEEEEEMAVEDKEEEAEVGGTPKRAGRSRRSVAHQPEDSVENHDVLPMEKKSATGTKSVTLVEPAAAEGVPEPSTPERRRPSLRGRTAKDDLFLTPGLPMSSKKRSAKRRRTATMIALSTAKSPEEAIKIIATSPMIELSRRTPKTKVSPEMRNQSLSLTFDESDFALAPVQLSSTFEAMSRDAEATADEQTSSSEPQPTPVAPTTAGSAEVQEVACSDSEKEKRDVSTFRERLAAEIKKLTQLSHHWTEIETNTDLPEEAQGQVRTTVCQAQLLMDSHKKSKFNRFAGLVDRCEAGDPSTTCQDLEGFWDLVYIEVKNIYNEFEQLERLQQNQWQADVPAVQASSSQPAKKTKKAAPSGSKKQKPVGKSKFAAFKAQLMKQRQGQDENSSNGDVPAEEKVFDAGFFKVNSPVRTPGYHCEAGTPSRGNSPSSKSRGHSSTPTSSKEPAPAPAPTTSTTTTTSPKKADNKENVAQVFLRRSMGGTPGRRSYVPSVPSPLLKDGGSAAHSGPLSPSKANIDASEGSDADVEEKAAARTPVRPRKSLTGRRSTRGRKSVSFLEKSQGEDENVDMTAFLQPFNSQSNSPMQEEAVMENSPFSVADMLKQPDNDASASASASPVLPLSSGRQGKNCLKSLPSSERRRSRRSVSFATSAIQSEGTVALPSTPYNANSLVPGRRVTRRSMASPSHTEQSPLGELKKLRATPPPKRSARPSLLYTPPKAGDQPRTGAKNVPVATLISFSP